MENQPKKGEWSQFWQNATSDTLVVFTFCLALFFSVVGIASDKAYLNALMTILSGFSLGYSVNRYTDMFKNKTEIEGLAENVANNLFAIVQEIIEESFDKKLAPEDYQTVSQICNVIKSLGKYHKIDLEPLRGQYKIKIEQGKLFYQNNPSGSFNEAPLEAIDKVFYYLGDAKHTESSGSNWRLAFQQLQQENSGNKFMGSGGLPNEPTFKTPDSPEKG